MFRSQKIAGMRACGGRPSRARQRGASTATWLLLAFVVIAAAAGVWWFYGRPAMEAATVVPATTGSTTSTPAAGKEAGTAPADLDALSVGDLNKAARAAISENRMVSPPGNNALEFYLRILARQPGDSNATDALRELFPFATGSVEDQINQGNFDEASRIMALLAQADPSNYTLTILRTRLDAKKRQIDQQQAQAAAAATRAPATGTATTAGPPSATAAAEAPQSSPAPAAATPPPATETARAAPVAPPPAPAPAAPVVAEPVGETRDARVVAPPRPVYPAAAVRSRQSGWVEVEFTVNADGSVGDAKVVASNPPRIFDREAVSAVQRARYDPRLERGEPVAQTLRRRIEFKLGE